MLPRIKILIFLFTVSLVVVVLGVAYYYYSHVLLRDERDKAEIKQLTGNKKAPPDPGLRRFDKAVEAVQGGSLDDGREQLYDMVKHFPDSSRVVDAKRIIGEMNMDALFSPNLNLNRKDHVVQPGESLNLIARKNSTTTEAIMRANGMMSSGLQPGDHLFVFPLDFEIIISVSKKTLTLKKNDRFFKEYQAVQLKLPPGVKPKPPGEPPAEIEINEKAAWFGGKRVQTVDPHFMSADKWLMGSRGFNIRSLPQAKVAGDNTLIVEPHAGKGASPTGGKTPRSKAPVRVNSSKRSQSKGAVLANTSVEDEDNTDPTSGAPETGVFLEKEDIEELFTIIRAKTKVQIVR